MFETLVAVIPVWGEAAISSSINYGMPSLLAPGNVPAVAAEVRCRFDIYGYVEDCRALAASAAVQALGRYGEVRFVPLHLDDEAQRRNQMYSHSLFKFICSSAIERLDPSGKEAIYFHMADAVMADGSLFNAVMAIKDGARAVLTRPQRVDEAVMRELLLPYVDPNSGGSLRVSPRELMAMQWQAEHPLVAASYWDAETFITDPAMIGWRSGTSGAVFGGLMPHPFLVWPTRPITGFNNVIDRDFAFHAVDDPDTVAVVRDSDQVAFVSTAPCTYMSELIGNRPADLDTVARWMASFDVSDAQLDVTTTPSLLHSHDVGPEDLAVFAKAEAVMRDLRDRVRMYQTDRSGGVARGVGRAG